jgi:hypothetical protein
MILVTPKVGAKRELLFNELASGFTGGQCCKTFFLSNLRHYWRNLIQNLKEIRRQEHKLRQKKFCNIDTRNRMTSYSGLD